MNNALTITDAAEILEPSFSRVESGQNLPFERPEKGDELSLDDAAAVLAERFGAERVKRTKKSKREITVEQAAAKIDDPAADVVAALPALRSRREDLSIARLICANELNEFVNSAQQAFAGMDDAALQVSDQWHAVCAHAQQLEANLQSALWVEQDAWSREAEAENITFTARRPYFSDADSFRAMELLAGMGVSEQEMLHLWQTPEAINTGHPACSAILAKAAGSEQREAVIGLLNDVGFDDDEIEAVVNGTMSVHLRDHRIQELVARALDADAPGQNRKAA